MMPETQEWINKAGGYWKVAGREMGDDDPVFHVVCSLSQQCAEKYLKAFLEENHQPIPRVHDLVVLAQATPLLSRNLATINPQLARLSTHGMTSRYPGVNVDRPAIEQSLSAAKEVRRVLRALLALPEEPPTVDSQAREAPSCDLQ